jgi:hypothetical protein
MHEIVEIKRLNGSEAPPVFEMILILNMRESAENEMG